jgi:hypothetical protein
VNRHFGRAKVITLKDMTAAAPAALPPGCAREGCTKTFKGDRREGLVWLLAYRSKKVQREPALSPATKWMRGAALCPTHALVLDARFRTLLGVSSGKRQCRHFLPGGRDAGHRRRADQRSPVQCAAKIMTGLTQYTCQRDKQISKDHEHESRDLAISLGR